MRGRKPKPTSLKKLEGVRKSRINGSEPEPEVGRVTCPRWLMPEAKKEWKRIVGELSALGLLTQLDRAAFAGYCQSWARFLESEETLNKEGPLVISAKGAVSVHPSTWIAGSSLKQMLKFAQEFGLTPSSRGRISVAPKAPGDPMDELLNTRREN